MVSIWNRVRTVAASGARMMETYAAVTRNTALNSLARNNFGSPYKDAIEALNDQPFRVPAPTPLDITGEGCGKGGCGCT